MKKIALLLLTIFNFSLIAQNVIIDISVINEYTNENISFANLKLVNLSTNQVLRKKTNFNGSIKLDLNSDQSYILYASAESDSAIVIFGEKIKEFTTNGLQNTILTTSMKIKPIFQKAGIQFIDKINFSIFNYNLDEISISKLENIASLMTSYPELSVEVAGYSACNLSDDDANTVSVERATAVFTYLTDAGIDYTRINAAAWGKTKSFTKCKCGISTKKIKPCTKKHHIINSCVKFKFSIK